MDDFNLADLGKPLYEHSQVLTMDELEGTRVYLYAYSDSLKWYSFITKFKVRIVIEAIEDAIVWLRKGKPGAV